MSWIKIIPKQEAVGKLQKLYRRMEGPEGQIDNILKVHSLRPHSLLGHMTLYKNVLHHHENTVEKWLLELIGVYVSILNGCDYCRDHHYEGLRRLLKEEDDPERMLQALKANDVDSLPEVVWPVLRYTRRLTLEPERMEQSHLEELRTAGYDDGQILEINQVVSYFAYANRTVQGLGVESAGEVLGYSPGGGEADNWTHE